ncbi:MAG TPA: hypothetical protein VGR30_07735 [Candidatus Binatia bacterium]|jgi:hypothetical protein|nr:hypothetical protein [Candidatus Binatia bacterium]
MAILAVLSNTVRPWLLASVIAALSLAKFGQTESTGKSAGPLPQTMSGTGEPIGPGPTLPNWRHAGTASLAPVWDRWPRFFMPV